jgi:hypothetical protein
MLDYAAARQGSDKRIGWRSAGALALPYEAVAFAVVRCQFGVLFFRTGGRVIARQSASSNPEAIHLTF